MINSRSLEDLQPSVYPRMVSFLAAAELELQARQDAVDGAKVKVVPTCTLRDGEYQAKIYAQGRTTPGAVVTNAKPGDSMHEFGCAMDFAVQIDGKITWEKEYYRIAGQIAMAQGLTWGGDWNGNGVMDKADWDLAHVQWSNGLTLAQLKAGEQLA